jgi:hypothetical protein
VAEGRILKRTISSDERVAQLSSHSALLYTMCIPHLDRDGRIEGHPIILRGKVVPYIAGRHGSEWTDLLVEGYMNEWIATLDERQNIAPLVLRYCVRGMWACWFPGFKNQRIRYDREAPSVLPPPPNDLLAQFGLLDADSAPETDEEREARLRLSLLNRARQMAHRARQKGVRVEDVDLYAVAARYGWTCHICSEPITEFTGKDSQCLSFDHIVPLDMGGDHTADNLAPAHFGCNAGKCNRQLRLSVTPGAEAEAEVQVQEPPDQRGPSRARARAADRAALPEISSSETSLDGVAAGVARRRAALASHGPLARLLEVLPDADANTPSTLHAWFDELGERAIEHARREILEVQPRQPSAYAVGIAKRLAREGAAA